MGNLESPYAQVTAFYSYWLGFTTVLDFFWADQYDAMAGPNRKSRRGLAEFVKKRDKRVIDMQIKRNEEMERRKEEGKQRKKELERQKAEKARNYEEPEWARVEAIEEDEAEDALEEKKNEFYCVACSKKFRSDKQWKNHEQSKKHKEKAAELREAFREEDIEYEEEALHNQGCYQAWYSFWMNDQKSAVQVDGSGCTPYSWCTTCAVLFKNGNMSTEMISSVWLKVLIHLFDLRLGEHI
ncbi:hypothetical protein AAHA92_14104 [Salvia divinorum]|uniref:C2H2-type domain-containing protein n=1 Tax=Salvia divinorum TaxID=28513 RepID=A0ABD1HAJ1_SALDI